jgi:hypothetical protein
MKGVLLHLLVRGLTTWPTGSIAITRDGTLAFLGVLLDFRLGKAPEAIREQRGATHWTPLIQSTSIILSRCSHGGISPLGFGVCIG